MRVYLEEAAGISKFKDRRRETETRMRHTRDNLERLNDLRDEVEKHLRHLNRQAATARRYKKLKGRERLITAELLALKLRELEDKSKAEERLVRERETALQAAIADQRAVETEIEKDRDRHSEKTEAFNEVQARYYKLGAEIARLEQAIQHGRELRHRQEQDRLDATTGLEEIAGHIERDEEELAALAEALDEFLPRLTEARGTEHESSEELSAAEQAMQEWREGWEAFNRRASDAQQSSHVERARIEHLEDQRQRIKGRQDRIADELRAIDVAELVSEIEPMLLQQDVQADKGLELETNLAQILDKIASARAEEHDLGLELDKNRKRLQELSGKLSALEALQRASSGKAAEATAAWLSERGLDLQPRVVQAIDVEPRWRLAVETVLGETLAAVCVEGIEAHARYLSDLQGGSVTLIDVEPLYSHRSDDQRLDSVAKGPKAVLSQLSSVHKAETVDDALAIRNGLVDGESVITPDGSWFGKDWVSVHRAGLRELGTLGREEEIREIRGQIARLRDVVSATETRLEEARASLARSEVQRESDQREMNRLHQQRADLTAALDARRSRVEQMQQRAGELGAEVSEADAQRGSTEEQLAGSRRRLDEALASLASLEGERRRLESLRDELGKGLDEVRGRAIRDRSNAQDLALQVEARRSTQASVQAGLERMRSQLSGLQTRVADLKTQLQQGEAPLAEMQQNLSAFLASSVDVKEELGTARVAVEAVENRLRNLEQDRLAREQDVMAVRDSLDQVRLTAREVKVRRETLLEQFQATGFELEAVFSELSPEATIEAWHEQLEDLSAKISRLGAINLAAIEEFKEESERKEYLDAQHADLTEALATLENAIRKIDKETKSRFRDTFEKVDAGFKELFPQLFGGGHAYLEMTGDDLLNAGITVMARPPGKRNSTIHLLSGGEKALTAVALVFAIFRLNPSPFCMLDEVDAPLDDANVERFCKIVKTMSEDVQFIIITHNKITMELANQLVGVTMSEPGVSRLVAVDVDEAVQMAAV